MGEGIGGASIARELSRYKLQVVVIDKTDSMPDEQSKAGQMTLYRRLMMLTSVVAKSFILKPGQLLHNPESSMVRQEDDSWRIWHKEWLPELDIPFRKSGVLVVATKERLGALSLIWKMREEFGGIYNVMERVGRVFLRDKEPHLNKETVGGLWATGHHATTVYPWDQTNSFIRKCSRKRGQNHPRGQSHRLIFER